MDKKTAVILGVGAGAILIYLLTRKVAAAEWPPPPPSDPTKATAYGVVFDTSYKVYPNITVEYRKLGGGGLYTTVTNREGRYVLENIEPGDYLVQLYTGAGVACGWTRATLTAGEATSKNVLTTLGG